MITRVGPPGIDGRPLWTMQVGQGGYPAAAGYGQLISWMPMGDCPLASGGKHLGAVFVSGIPSVRVLSAPGLPPETKTAPCPCNWSDPS